VLARRLLAAYLTLAFLPAVALAADEPDLVPEIRQTPYSGQVAPIFVDAYEEPGRLLYRFDSILNNQGGALDIFRDSSTGAAKQAVWDGGTPSETPDPNQAPTSADATTLDSDASFDYVYEKTHHHWHFFSAARYALELPDGTVRTSEKVGFCLFDSFTTDGGSDDYFPANYKGSGQQTWCAPGYPNGGFVRMGLSPGGADRYTSQTGFQWVDIDGLRPGNYVLRATANPDGTIAESDTSNNTISKERIIPGVLAADRAVGRSGDGPVSIPLSGDIVAPEIPARRSAQCTPSRLSMACYVTASASGPLKFRIASGPANGSAEVTGASGLEGTAVYRPAAGYRGVDSFTYTATDARGLESAPATVSIGPASAGPAPASRPLLAGYHVRRGRGGWQAILRLGAATRVSGQIDRGRGRRFRRHRIIRARWLPAGRKVVNLGRLKAGRYRLRLRLATADGRRERIVRGFRAGATGAAARGLTQGVASLGQAARPLLSDSAAASLLCRL
jgi:hypothetical protein